MQEHADSLPRRPEPLYARPKSLGEDQVPSKVDAIMQDQLAFDVCPAEQLRRPEVRDLRRHQQPQR